MRITDKYLFFWGGVFSNFFKTSFLYKGLEFTTSEQAFMWEKAKFFSQDVIAQKILKETDPRQCKFWGREIPNFDREAWMEVAYGIMTKVNISKFTQDIALYAELLDTEERIFVECSPHDKIWGIGLHYNDDAILNEENWQGQNLLGKALMEVREKIKN